MTVRQKTVVTQKLSGEAKSHSLTEVKCRDVISLIDEPAERGGTNKGLTPTETMMASLMGCTSVIFHKTAHANGVHIHALNIRLETQFDRRGVTLQEEVAVPFPKITMYLDLRTDADDAKIEEAKRQLNMFCPVAKVIRASGSELEEIWTVQRP
jgi:uncharacterized OsmC-like protein